MPKFPKVFHTIWRIKLPRLFFDFHKIIYSHLVLVTPWYVTLSLHGHIDSISDWLSTCGINNLIVVLFSFSATRIVWNDCELWWQRQLTGKSALRLKVGWMELGFFVLCTFIIINSWWYNSWWLIVDFEKEFLRHNRDSCQLSKIAYGH